MRNNSWTTWNWHHRYLTVAGKSFEVLNLELVMISSSSFNGTEPAYLDGKFIARKCPHWTWSVVSYEFPELIFGEPRWLRVHKHPMRVCGIRQGPFKMDQPVLEVGHTSQLGRRSWQSRTVTYAVSERWSLWWISRIRKKNAPKEENKSNIAY